jgi:hypothetical protein
MHNGKETYVSPYAQIRRKTAGPSPVHTAPNKPAPTANTTKRLLVNNEKDLRHLETQFFINKKKLYSMKPEILKKHVRISKSMPAFHIMCSLYEVHE